MKPVRLGVADGASGHLCMTHYGESYYFNYSRRRRNSAVLHPSRHRFQFQTNELHLGCIAFGKRVAPGPHLGEVDRCGMLSILRGSSCKVLSDTSAPHREAHQTREQHGR